MPGRGPVVRVDGIKEVRKGLVELGRAPERREFTQAYRSVSAMAASDLRKVVPTGPPKGGHAKQRIRAGASQSGARVYIPRRTVPYYGWLDFGSRRPRRGQRRSVGPWKNSGPGPGDGRYAYPTVKKYKPKYVRMIRKALNDVIDRLGL